VDGLTWQDYGADLERKLAICMIGSIGERTGRCQAGDSTYQSRMDDSDRSRLPPWKTRWLISRAKMIRRPAVMWRSLSRLTDIAL
jgi:hypothetical protein